MCCRLWCFICSMVCGAMPARKSTDSKIVQVVEFGERIRERRNSLEISQEQLADRIRMHRTYIGHVERGEVNPTLVTMLQLAAGLGVEAAELIAGLSIDPTAPQRS